jgi:Na+/H+ antiporter NhaC
MQFGPESLLPPLVAIVLAIATRKVVLPLAAGVFVGACLLAHANVANMSLYDLLPLVTIDPTVREASLIDTSWWHAPIVFLVALKESIFAKSHLQALAFSLLVGAMVGVLEGAGGMRALIERLSNRIRSRRGAQTMIATSGLAIFFDDYANSLLIGGTMRSTADRYRISREKLAYLVDSTAAPVAGLALVSTWAAIEISYMGEGLKSAGITDPTAAFGMFIQSIPYRFYPWLAIAMVLTIAITDRDFGAMRKAELAAVANTDGQPDGGDSQRNQSASEMLWMAAVAPVVVCIAAVICVLVITGSPAANDLDPSAGLLRFTGQIMGNGDSYFALIVGGAAGLVVAIGCHLALRGCDPMAALKHSFRGSRQMMSAILILWFAWALSAMTEPDRLDTGGYLSSVLSDRLDPRLLPTAVFLLAGAVAFSTGTSWGTMGILTPLSISLALQLDPSGGPGGAIALATCGAVLAGAIFGDHCSPISDTTVLSSRASDCDHVAHVRTQMPYALVVAVVCVVVGTLPAALGVSPWLSLLAGVTGIAIIVRFVGKRSCETDAVA